MAGGRQARKLIAQRVASTTPQVNADEEEDDDVPEEDVPVRKSAFALLALDDDNDETTQNNDDNEDEPDTSATATTEESSKKKKKKKKKGKKKASANDSDEELDEIDRTLNELNAQRPSSSATSESIATEKATATLQSAYQKFFAVETKQLDADAEMRRLFGSKIVNADLAQRRPHNAKRVLKKTLLVNPRETWPVSDRGGLSMELLDTRGATSYFQFIHLPRYQEVQFLFLDSVNSLDPQNVMHVLNMHPFHIDSLLTLSEVCKHQSDIAMAAELVERALYNIERAFHPLFNIATGLCRLNFSRTENRSFFLALFRHVQYLARRGCWRTAMEFSKLLISLDPGSDPLGGLLMIDFYALRARDPTYVIELYDSLGRHKSLHLLPNWAYSYALARFHQESEQGKDHSISTGHLVEAMARFPSAVLPLAELCGITLPTRALRHAYLTKPVGSGRAEVLNVLVALFVERCSSLWKEPEVIEWWRPQVERVLDLVDQNDAIVQRNIGLRKNVIVTSSLNLYRHVLITDVGKVTRELPRNISSGAILMHDPLPPPDATIGYTRPQRLATRQQQQQQQQPDNNDESGRIAVGDDPYQAFLRSLLPWAHVGNPNPNPNPAVPPTDAIPEQVANEPLLMDWLRRAQELMAFDINDEEEEEEQEEENEAQQQQ